MRLIAGLAGFALTGGWTLRVAYGLVFDRCGQQHRLLGP